MSRKRKTRLNCRWVVNRVHFVGLRAIAAIRLSQSSDFINDDGEGAGRAD
jgi:hypothetical protein